MNKTLEPRVRSNFLSLMMAARVVRSNLFSLMMAASTSQLDLSRKKSQWHIVINFFLKNTSSPVNVMEKWRTAGRCWKENSYAKMRSWRELKKNWYVLRMTLFIYPLKRKSENLWTLGVRKIKEFNPRGIWLNECEKDFEPQYFNTFEGRHRNWPLILTLQLLWEASCWPLSQPPPPWQRQRGAFVFTLERRSYGWS